MREQWGPAVRGRNPSTEPHRGPYERPMAGWSRRPVLRCAVVRPQAPPKAESRKPPTPRYDAPASPAGGVIGLAIALFAIQAGFHGYTASLPLALSRGG